MYSLKSRKQHIVIIEFDTARGVIDFDYEEIEEETPRKYLWLGNAKANNPQDRFTTNNLDYLISQTIPNFGLLIPGGKLGEIFEKLKDKFYYDVGTRENQGEKYRYIWNVEKLKVSSRDMEELWEKSNNSPKKMANLVSNEIYEYLKREKEPLTKKEIALFTLKIDNQLMVDLPEYMRYLENSMVEDLFSDRIIGVCYLCQRENEITQDMTGFDFKYYITDKIGFSSELQKDGFLKNFSLCKECYKKLLVGESFVKNNLKSRLAGTKLYVIPKFIFLTSLSIDRLKKWAEYINVSFSSSTSLKKLKAFKGALEDYPEFEKEKNNFILNLLFWKKIQSEFRVLKLIKDVPPSRFDILTKETTKVHDIGVKLLGENDRWYLKLSGMYYLLPVRMASSKRGGKEIVDYKRVLDFYDALFSAKPISYKFLVEQFVELACVYRFEKFDNYNITSKNPEIDIIHFLLRANLLLLYLKKLRILEGSEKMEEELNVPLLPEGIKDYLRETEYTKTQAALFLLGYFVGEIGNAQYSPENRTKPILNKIIYQGMNTGKLLRLTNEIFEKLRQYKRLSYNEGIFGEMKRLLDREIRDWDLSDQENVFYVLSGYAYNTHKALTKKE